MYTTVTLTGAESHAFEMSSEDVVKRAGKRGGIPLAKFEDASGRTVLIRPDAITSIVTDPVG
jgi:hypothetical protein